MQLANSPDYEVASLRRGTPIPRFWLGVGTADSSGLRDTEIFYHLLQPLQPGVPLRLAPGGHMASTWRELLPSMLEWMTRGLAAEAAHVSNPSVHVSNPGVPAAQRAAITKISLRITARTGPVARTPRP